MAPTGHGAPGVWKQSGAGGDVRRYAAAIRLLQWCRGLVLLHPWCLGSQENLWVQSMVLSMNPQTGSLREAGRTSESTTCL